MCKPKARRLLFLFCLSIGISNWSYALTKNKLIQVTSDSASLSQKEHQGTYRGHVQFTEGEAHIQAAKAITRFSLQNQLIVAIVQGSKERQAHYWSQTKKTEPPFHAYADSMWYYPLRHLIQLKGHARIEQGNNSFTATNMSFDTLNQHLISQSDGQSRARIIIHSEKKYL